MEADFQSHHGIDLSQPRYRNPPWRWFRVRLHGLLTAQTVTPDGLLIPATRLAQHFYDDDTEGGGEPDGE